MKPIHPYKLVPTLRKAKPGAVLWTSTIDRTVTAALARAKRQGSTKRFVAVSPTGDEVFNLVRVTIH